MKTILAVLRITLHGASLAMATVSALVMAYHFCVIIEDSSGRWAFMPFSDRMADGRLEYMLENWFQMFVLPYLGVLTFIVAPLHVVGGAWYAWGRGIRCRWRAPMAPLDADLTT